MDKSIENVFKHFSYFISEAMKILIKEDFDGDVYMRVKDFENNP